MDMNGKSGFAVDTCFNHRSFSGFDRFARGFQKTRIRDTDSSGRHFHMTTGRCPCGIRILAGYRVDQCMMLFQNLLRHFVPDVVEVRPN